MGTTGESATLEKEEKVQLFDFCAEKIAGRVPLERALAVTIPKALSGILICLICRRRRPYCRFSPYYNKPNAAGFVAHFGAVAKRVRCPLFCITCLPRTGSNMPVDVTLKLAKEYSNIVAIKEASGNLEQISQIIKDKEPDFMVISGDDNLTLPILLPEATALFPWWPMPIRASFRTWCAWAWRAILPPPAYGHYDLL